MEPSRKSHAIELSLFTNGNNPKKFMLEMEVTSRVEWIIDGWIIYSK